MKIKTLFVCFFKCLFFKRVCAVIFELVGVSTYNFVKFQFQRMTLKIEREFERRRKNCVKTGQNGHEISNQNEPMPMQNFFHDENIHFFKKIISLFTI